jgi:hypothetical protein
MRCPAEKVSVDPEAAVEAVAQTTCVRHASFGVRLEPGDQQRACGGQHPPPRQRSRGSWRSARSAIPRARVGSAPSEERRLGGSRAPKPVGPRRRRRQRTPGSTAPWGAPHRGTDPVPELRRTPVRRLGDRRPRCGALARVEGVAGCWPFASFRTHWGGTPGRTDPYESRDRADSDHRGWATKGEPDQLALEPRIEFAVTRSAGGG